MSGVARYVKFTAQPERGGELAGRLLDAADSLRDTAGCELYLVNRSRSEPDVVWVTELWLDQASVDASLEQLRTEEGQALLAEVTVLPVAPTARLTASRSGRWWASSRIRDMTRML